MFPRYTDNHTVISRFDSRQADADQHLATPARRPTHKRRLPQGTRRTPDGTGKYFLFGSVSVANCMCVERVFRYSAKARVRVLRHDP